MRNPILKAIAVLFFGTIVLPGCYCVGPGWWGPDRDERWKRHHRKRRAALTPHEDKRQRDDIAQRANHDNSIG